MQLQQQKMRFFTCTLYNPHNNETKHHVLQYVLLFISFQFM